MPVEKDMGAVLLRIVQRNTLLQVCVGWRQLSKPYQGVAECKVGFEEKSGLLHTLS